MKILSAAQVRELDTYTITHEPIASIDLMEILFAQEGKPDGIWFYEDMGFKQRPFMSPDMYREIVMPGHRKPMDYCHSLGLKVIMHSCGFIEPLLPGMVEAGPKVFEEFQRRLAAPLRMEDFRLQDTYYHLEDEHSIHPAYPVRMSARAE